MPIALRLRRHGAARFPDREVGGMKLHVLSLGAGVQSTTMALMAAHGEIEPMPDCAIFADTGAEPKGVYEHLEWLMSPNVLPFPVHLVSAGNLGESIAASRPKGKYLRVDIPAFAKAPDGSVAPITRSCTRDYKITPIRRKVRELLGIAGKRSPKESVCVQWIGISRDEAGRMKPTREPWWESRWPLIEKMMSRQECLQWMKKNDYPKPQKSACVFCPFHDIADWRSLTSEEFEEAVEVDERLRDRPPEAYRAKGTLYLHRACIPLKEVDFSTAEDRGQLNMFNNECEGMCGV